VLRSPFSDYPNHFIRRLVRRPTIAKQIGKASREGGPLALRKSKDFSTGMSCVLFAPLEVIKFRYRVVSCLATLLPDTGDPGSLIEV
jgi:hypothetical protein